jgi:branched-chain amino acid aminotransferase
VNLDLVIRSRLKDPIYSSNDHHAMTSPLPFKEGIAFENLPWNLNLPDEVSYVHLKTTSEWTKEHFDPVTDSGALFDSVHKYSEVDLAFHPATTSLNYGTTIWEGLKCFRKKDGTPVVFRPDRNYERFARGAEQMYLPVPSKELFMRAVQHIVQENAHVIPPHGDGMKLYIRPMLLGSGQQLGLYPSSEFSLLFYLSPTVRPCHRFRYPSFFHSIHT